MMTQPQTIMAIQMSLPADISPDVVKVATSQCLRFMEELRPHGPDAFRGYLQAAKLDGFQVEPDKLFDVQLETTFIRAYWWAFERVCNGHTLPSERARMLH
jgi:hypothetical protein